MHLKKNLLAPALVCLLSLSACASRDASQPAEKTGFYLDTVCTIRIYAMENAEDLSGTEQNEKALSLIESAFSLCAEYESRLSKTAEGSDIYRINHAAGQPVSVNTETVEVLEKALEYAALSNGKFDVTIGAISQLWDFTQTAEDGSRTGTVPDEAAIAGAISHVDYAGIRIEGNTVTLQDPEAEIDLGGIAKGYIGDKISDYLKEEGVTSALISLGGNIIAIGEKSENMDEAGREDFSVGITSPDAQDSTVEGVIRCANKTVVTSGTYERYFEENGVRYHHILDPATGYPVETDLLSATVIGETGTSADCDALSTICLMLGSEKGMALIRELEDVEAVFIDEDGEVLLSSEKIAWQAQ